MGRLYCAPQERQVSRRPALGSLFRRQRLAGRQPAAMMVGRPRGAKQVTATVHHG